MEQKTHDLNVNYLARCLEASILPGNEFTYPGWSHPTGYVKHRFTLPPAEDLTKVRLLNRHWVAHCWYRYCTVMVSWCQMMLFSERNWVIANLMPLILCSCSCCEVSLCLLVIALMESVETPGTPVRSPQFQLRATDSASEGLFTLHEKMVWSQNQTWKAYNLFIVVTKGTTRRFFQAISFHVRWKADCHISGACWNFNGTPLTNNLFHPWSTAT